MKSGPSGGTGAIGFGVVGLGIGLAGLLASPVSPLRAEPAVACNPMRSNDYLHTYFDGWYRQDSSVLDVNSNLKVVNPFVYPLPIDPHANFSVAWTMLQDANAHVAQVGWEKAPGATGQLSGFGFYYTDNFTPVWAGPWGITQESTPAFKTEWDSVNHKFKLYINGGNPVFTTAQVAWTPSVAVVSGETKTKASQMPGQMAAPADLETFRNSIVKLGANWVTFSGTRIEVKDPGEVNTGIHKFTNWGDGKSYDIWDICLG